MEPFLTRKQARELDSLVIEAGVPSLVLMENAGRGAAEVIMRQWSGGRLLVVCGAGNNAGDGLVVARRWLLWGFPVCVWLTTTALSADAMQQLRAYEACHGRTILDQPSAWESEARAADVLVDALFGTGLSRSVDGRHAELIALMNASGKPIVALDLPSGLDSDRGVPLGLSVSANTTISFGAAKRASATTHGVSMCGQLQVVDIGAPLPLDTLTDVIAWQPSAADVQAKLATRGAVTHKGQAGHVVVVAGSMGTTGAALLAAKGAFRAGAGLVTVATHAEVARLYETAIPEVMNVGLDSGSAGAEKLERLLDRATSVVVGPGLGLGEDAARWVECIVNRFNGTVVVDADAITLCARLAAWSRRGNLVFTPHPGEAARLLGTTSQEIEADRFGALARLVVQTDNVVVLKGAPSLVGNREMFRVNRRGASCMSTAGSGDVLSGVIAAVACQLGAFDAAWVGAWVHAAAGELWMEAHGGQRGMIASELADNVVAALASLDAARRVGRD